MSIALLNETARSGLSGRVLAGGPDLTRYLLVCGVLIALVAGLGWAARRWLAGSLRGRASLRSLQVLEVLPLGPKHRVGVLRCQDRSFLVGFGEGGVRLLTELEPPERAGDPLSAEQRRIFAAALQRAAGRLPDAPPARPGRAPARATDAARGRAAGEAGVLA